jgi:hypothetical protein
MSSAGNSFNKHKLRMTTGFWLNDIDIEAENGLVLWALSSDYLSASDEFSYLALFRAIWICTAPFNILRKLLN